MLTENGTVWRVVRRPKGVPDDFPFLTLDRKNYWAEKTARTERTRLQNISDRWEQKGTYRGFEYRVQEGTIEWASPA